MKIEFQKSVDAGFAANLTRINMASYYATRNISWDNNAFIQSWEEYENYLITYDAQAVGVLRLSSFRHMFLIRDIQIDECFQNKGIGRQCINFAIALAHKGGFSVLGLRVFSENPARKLYERMGFVATGEPDGLVQMELSLAEKMSTKDKPLTGEEIGNKLLQSVKEMKAGVAARATTVTPNQVTSACLKKSEE